MSRAICSLWVSVFFFWSFNSFSIVSHIFLDGALPYTGLLGQALVERQLYYFGGSAVFFPFILMILVALDFADKQRVQVDLQQYVVLIIATFLFFPSLFYFSNLAYDLSGVQFLYSNIGESLSRVFTPFFGFWGVLFLSLAMLSVGVLLFYSLFKKPFVRKGKKTEEKKTPPLKHPKKSKTSFRDVEEFPSVGELPPLRLLNKPNKQSIGLTDGEKNKLTESVERALSSFKISAKVKDIVTGPVVTRVLLELASGTKVTKVLSVSNDIARVMKVSSVRVVDAIPGSSAIGIEVPNTNRATVVLSDVLSTSTFAHSKATLPLALGMDITGASFMVDLAKAPHLLVAGTTGSGKSVGVNTMILSLIYKLSPEELRFIMIDPKMLELSVYEGIPHMYAPVVTDMKKATEALSWCVAEMDRRYALLSKCGVRGIDSFNKLVEKSISQGNPLEVDGDKIESKLPYIVVVIDEFADLIMVAGKRVEELVARIAQKARASGIHMILATQRPSVDVLTGLIKANVPSRISFQVSSKIDSRTILDQGGGEQLLGSGDMLVSMGGASKLTRVHGSFVEDSEVQRIVSYLSSQGEPSYVDLCPKAEAEDGLLVCDDADREVVMRAQDILEDGKPISISKIQRRLRIGYNKAARVVEVLEENGILVSDEKGIKVARL